MPPLPLARFDLVSVRLAVLAAQSGSLTAAAAESHLALAAASRRLRDLEAAVGLPLFERHPRGLRPTQAGRVFVKHGLTLLQTMAQLGAELGDLRHGIARHVRLAASTAAISQFLPPLLARYAQLRPQVRVDLEEQVSDQVVATLREGRADIGIFVEGPDASGLHTRLFRADELVLVLPDSHALAAVPGLKQTRGRAGMRAPSPAAPVAFAELLDQDWIGLNTGAAVLQAQQQAALAAGRPLRLRMQVRSFDAACHMVASGLGLAVLPKAATLPLLQAMALTWRPLADAWAQRRLLLATLGGGPQASDREPAPASTHADASVLDLAAFLAQPPVAHAAPRTANRTPATPALSQNAKPARRKRQ